MLKKSIGAIAAALGLMSLPVAAVEGNKPVPAESQQQAQENPVAKTDGRHSRAWVPKGVRKRNKSRLTRFAKLAFNGALPNRFIRRACAKAIMKGRGRANALPGETRYIRYPQGQTTARAIERARGRVHE